MALFSAVIIALMIWTKLKHSENRCTPGSPKVIAFFHPYCSGGGGGERVLWKMIEVLGDIVDRGRVLHQVVVYTVDAPSLAYKEGTYVGANKLEHRTGPQCTDCRISRTSSLTIRRTSSSRAEVLNTRIEKFTLVFHPLRRVQAIPCSFISFLFACRIVRDDEARVPRSVPIDTSRVRRHDRLRFHLLSG
jgi:ALG11 mannosyltransferase N-terminus